MSKNVDPLDHAFEELRSRVAATSDSFSRKLEDRVMQELQKNRSGPGRRSRLLLAVGGTVAILGIAAAGYATDGFTALPWTVTVGNNGVITDEGGNVVGKSVDNEDGTSTTTIWTGETTGMMGPSDESMKGKKIIIGPLKPNE